MWSMSGDPRDILQQIVAMLSEFGINIDPGLIEIVATGITLVFALGVLWKAVTWIRLAIFKDKTAITTEQRMVANTVVGEVNHRIKATEGRIEKSFETTAKANGALVTAEVASIVANANIGMEEKLREVIADEVLKALISKTSSDPQKSEEEKEADRQPTKKSERIYRADALRSVILDKFMDGVWFDELEDFRHSFIYIGSNKTKEEYTILVSTPYHYRLGGQPAIYSI